jgi:hypothetical protein
MGRRLRRHLSLAIAGAPNRLEAERRGLRAFLEFVRANPDLWRVAGEAQFVDPAVFQRYYQDFAASYRAGLPAAEQLGEIAPGDCRGVGLGADGHFRHGGPPFRAVDGQVSLRRIAEAAHALILDGLTPRRG